MEDLPVAKAVGKGGTIRSRMDRGGCVVLGWAVFTATMLSAMAVYGLLNLHHFTYWGWLCQLLFYIAWFVTIVSDAVCFTDQAEAVFLVAAAPFMMGILVAIALLIALLPLMDPGIIEAQSDGWDLGLLNVANIFIHYVPVMLFTNVLSGRTHAIRDFVAGANTRSRHRHLATSIKAVVFVSGVVLPISLGGVYASRFDFQHTYSVHADHASVYAAGLGCLFFSSFLLYTFLFAPSICSVPITKNPHTQG